VDVSLLLNNAGALVTTGLGVMARVRPSLAATFVSIRPEGLLGVSEIRATYGGLFAALGRTLSVVVDRNVAAKNLGGIAFEAAIGLLLLAR
jgi:hypothetical protein